MPEYSEIVYSSLREIVHVLFRHKGKMLAVFLLISAAVTAGVYVWPATYQSEASLLMRMGRENLPNDPTVENTLLQVGQDRTSEVRSIIAVLTSEEIARKTVETVGEGWILDDMRLPRHVEIPGIPDYDSMTKKLSRLVTTPLKEAMYLLQLKPRLEPFDAAVEAVMDGLEVEVERQSNIIDLAFKADSGPVAKTVLDTIVSVYMERHREVFAQQVSPVFFEEKVSTLEKSLAESEAALNAYRAQNNIASIEAQKETLLQQISVLEGELGDAGATYEGLQAMVKALERELGGRGRTQELSRTTGMPNYAADTLKEKLINLRIEEKDLAARYTDEHRPLVELREKIALVEQQLTDETEFLTEVTTGLDSNVLSLENRLENERANLDSGRARLESLRTEVTRLKAELAQLASTEGELVRLTRNQELIESEYRDYRERLNKSNLTASLDQDNVTNVRVVQAATTPRAPIAPKKLRTIALGLLLGLFAGVALAFVLEYFDDTINTPEDVERWVKVPVLASISDQEFRKCT
jgi:uncharacterized protein involved in exopolysaccharide biosynthesis